MNTLQQKIEALIFFKNEPVSYKWLAQKLDLSEEEVKKEVQQMTIFYENRGIQIIFSEDSVSLLSHPIAQDVISSLVKNEEERDLSKQALETLAIILYKKEITKSEIDYIRGVNSVFILRNLLIRGLIQKKENKEDKRSPYYIATHDLFAFLEIHNSEELPEFEAFQEKIKNLHNDWQSEESSLSEQ